MIRIKKHTKINNDYNIDDNGGGGDVMMMMMVVVVMMLMMMMMMVMSIIIITIIIIINMMMIFIISLYHYQHAVGFDDLWSLSFHKIKRAWSITMTS